MAECTPQFSLPYPVGDDQVAVHTDVQALARKVDIEMTSQGANISRLDQTKYSRANGEQVEGDISRLDTTMLPRDEAEQYGIEGPEGPEGPRGKQGIPGVDSVPADEAVAAYLTADESETRQAADALFGGRGQVFVQATPPATSGVAYEWAGEPHASESIKRVDGVEVARNLIPNPSYEESGDGLASGSGVPSIVRTTSSSAVAVGTSAVNIETVGAGVSSGWVSQDTDTVIRPGQWVAVSTATRRSSGATHAMHRFNFRDESGGIISTVSSDIWELTTVPNSENPRNTFVAQIPDGTHSITATLRLHGSASGDAPQDGWTNTDAWLAVVADTEADALAQVETYFDGDTPSENSSDLWINTADNTPYKWDAEGNQWTPVGGAGHVVNAADYGLSADGETDDQPTIQDILSVMPEGGTLAFPPNRTVLLENPIEINRRITITGGTFTTPTGKAFLVTADDVTIDGVAITGPGVGAGYEIRNHGIDVLGTEAAPVHRTTITRCQIWGMRDTAIWMEYVNDFTISDVHIEDFIYAGALVKVGRTGTITGTTVRNGVWDGESPCYGIALTGEIESTTLRSDGIIVSHCHIQDIPDRTGLDTHGGTNITFAFNHVKGCKTGITGTVGNIDRYTAPERLAIIGNTIVGAEHSSGTTAGIALGGSPDEHSLDPLWADVMAVTNIIRNVDRPISLPNDRGEKVDPNLSRITLNTSDTVDPDQIPVAPEGISVGELSTENLNDVTGIKGAATKYEQSADANATEARNYPAVSYGILEVITPIDGIGVLQRYTSLNSSGGGWTRRRNSAGEWSEWVAI